MSLILWQYTGKTFSICSNATNNRHLMGSIYETHFQIFVCIIYEHNTKVFIPLSRTPCTFFLPVKAKKPSSVNDLISADIGDSLIEHDIGDSWI